MVVVGTYHRQDYNITMMEGMSETQHGYETVGSVSTEFNCNNFSSLYAHLTGKIYVGARHGCSTTCSADETTGMAYIHSLPNPIMGYECGRVFPAGVGLD